MTKDDRKLILPLLIGALPFLFAGIDGLSQGKHALGAVNLLMVAVNLLALRFVKKTPEMTNAIVFLANGALACVISYDYFLAGKKGLPYAWAVVVFGYLVSAAVFYRKARRLKDAPTSPPPPAD